MKMRRLPVGIIALAIIAAACEVPTSAPNWDMTWDVPMPDSGRMNIPLTSFLPAGVTVDNPATRLNATVNSFPQISRSLGASCSGCTNGVTAPKPAFTAPATTSTIALTAGNGLTSATLGAGSQVSFTLTNGFNFDPIRPQPSAAQTAANTGTITITVNNGTTTLGTLALQGLATAFPANATTAPFTIPLSGTFVSSQPLTVTMTMISPAGDVVTMNTAQVFTVNPAAMVNISSAMVSVPSQPITASNFSVPLDQIDAGVANRIADSTTSQGKLMLTVTTPFTVGANATLTLAGLTASGSTITPIVKPIVIPAATAGSSTFTISVDLTGQQLRQMVGGTVTGTLSGATIAGSTAVTPASVVTIASRMQIHLYARAF